MNISPERYVLDANVFMTAYHHYYAPDLCPGFWDCLSHYFSNGELVILDRVRDEVLSPQELVRWLNSDIAGTFSSTADAQVAAAYGQVMASVRENPQFMQAAVDEFARGADGWLVAYSIVNSTVLVTNEVYDANVRRRVPIPNLCANFVVNYVNTFEMLRRLGAHFTWPRA